LLGPSVSPACLLGLWPSSPSLSSFLSLTLWPHPSECVFHPRPMHSRAARPLCELPQPSGCLALSHLPVSIRLPWLLVRRTRSPRGRTLPRAQIRARLETVRTQPATYGVPHLSPTCIMIHQKSPRPLRFPLFAISNYHPLGHHAMAINGPPPVVYLFPAAHPSAACLPAVNTSAMLPLPFIISLQCSEEHSFPSLSTRNGSITP
jgi:hypothetical protein